MDKLLLIRGENKFVLARGGFFSSFSFRKPLIFLSGDKSGKLESFLKFFSILTHTPFATSEQEKIPHSVHFVERRERDIMSQK